MGDSTPPSAEQAVRPGGIVIVTVTKVEAQAVLHEFAEEPGQEFSPEESGDTLYYSLGTHWRSAVYMVQSEMGSATPGGALLTVRQAIQDLQPRSVIMCGIAFGLRPDKQKLGDILVARQLQCYEPQKVDARRGRLARGDRATASERLLHRFRAGDNNWQGAPTHFGLVLSGEKLINNPAFTRQLLAMEKEAIGGEMEGAGLYAAARDAKVDWIVVKAICDWADGKKNDSAQELAARNAARFVAHALGLPGKAQDRKPVDEGETAVTHPLPTVVGPAARSDRPQTEVRRPVPRGWGFDSPRLEPLWRLAYALVRLDQLPSGGWGKGLYSWMEALWKGDTGTIDRTQDTRKKGGTDLTACTFYWYYLFLRKILPPAQLARLLNDNNTANWVYQDFAGRLGYKGAIGLGRPRGGEAADVHLRHTLMGVITFLVHAQASGLHSTRVNLDETYDYLIDNLPEWQHDRSHLLAMVGAAVKLHDILEQTTGPAQLAGERIAKLRSALADWIPPMMAAATAPVTYNPRPAGTIRGPLWASTFRPYKDFWRMERSNLVMYFPFFVTDDGSAFLPTVSPEFRSRCARIFAELLEDISLPYDGNTPYKHLIHYHQSSGRIEAPRDWGLSAELAVLLCMKAVRELLIEEEQITPKLYEERRLALNRALVDTFDAYSRHDERFGNGDLFEFTFGFSFGHVLHLFDWGQIQPEELRELDTAVTRLCAEGVTEKGLAALIREQIDPEPGETGLDQRAVRDMMIAKLESGEHTPDDVVCNKSNWEQTVADAVDRATLDFYNGELGTQHAQHYATTPRRSLILQIEDLFQQRPQAGRRALDVGCGAGQYAEHLADLGFEVELLDASPKLLKMACQRLGHERSAVKPVNIFDISWGYPEEHFDLIFASAIMIHVPKDRRAHVYSTFYRLLKPDGLLFVTYKIGDHTLIAEDGRYFAYYRDSDAARSELEAHGFCIQQECSNFSTSDMYLYPKLMRWVSFCCLKKEP